MNEYVEFAKYYDSAMGNRTDNGSFIERQIRKFHPSAHDILEIGCGTGEIIKYLSDNGYEVAGIDLSERMLSLAQEKLPGSLLERQDMRSFNLENKYDGILCLFDTINHLVSFDDWIKVFITASAHLRLGGLFIFDINSEDKISKLGHSVAITKDFDGKIMSMRITKEGDVYNWHIEIKDKSLDGRLLVSEDIKEISFPVSKIEEALRRYYSEVIMLDEKGGDNIESAERIYFICKK